MSQQFVLKLRLFYFEFCNSFHKTITQLLLRRTATTSLVAYTILIKRNNSPIKPRAPTKHLLLFQIQIISFLHKIKLT